MYEHEFRPLMYYVSKRIKFIKLHVLYHYVYYVTFWMVQRYENMDTAHGSGWEKWMFFYDLTIPIFIKAFDALSEYQHVTFPAHP